MTLGIRGRYEEQQAPVSAAVLVVSDDAILREGVRQAIERSGLPCAATSSCRALDLAAPVWDYVMVLPESARKVDRFACVDTVPELTKAMPQSTVVAYVAREIGDVARLRFAEAGVQFLANYYELEADPEAAARQMQIGSVESRLQLPTPFALRAKLGFRLTGDVASFLSEAAKVPIETWTTDRTQARLGIPRQEIERLRRLAGQSAGVPEPVTARFSSSAVRAATEFPAWQAVRAFVRESWGLAR